MADVETNITEGTVVSKTVETTVADDGTTVVTEETTVVEVNGDHTNTETTTTDVIEEVKTNKDIEPKAGENGQVAKEKVEEENPPKEVESTVVEADAAIEPVEAETGGEVDAQVIEETPQKEETTPKVILHQFPPGRNVPSLSHFCLKLETFLRMNKIPYENQYGYKMGKKGKLPWIEYQGERKQDSNIIIDYLKEKFDVVTDKDLTDDQHALARALQVMVEENTYTVLLYNRWIDNFNEFKKIMSPQTGGGIGFSVSMKMFQRKTRSNLEGHGMGRHTKDEVYSIGKKDLAALSQLLGEKEFILGSNPSSYDCSFFGLLANIISSGLESPLSQFIQENAKNLIQYCERMKELYWQDWADMILGEKAEPALKKGFSFRKKKTKTPKAPKEQEPEKAAEEDGPAETKNEDEDQKPEIDNQIAEKVEDKPSEEPEVPPSEQVSQPATDTKDDTEAAQE